MNARAAEVVVLLKRVFEALRGSFLGIEIPSSAPRLFFSLSSVCFLLMIQIWFAPCFLPSSRSPGSYVTNFSPRRCTAWDTAWLSNMLVTSTTMGMVYRVHCNPSYHWIISSFPTICVPFLPCFHEWFLLPSATGSDSNSCSA